MIDLLALQLYDLELSVDKKTFAKIFSMNTLNDFDFSGNKALIRVDFNVPLNEAGEVTDDTRLRAAVPTIKKILNDGGRAILMSHLGRPKNGPEEKFSLKHILSNLSSLLGTDVHFANDCVGDDAITKSKSLESGQVLLLENVRFYKEETSGDRDFAEKLSRRRRKRRYTYYFLCILH